MKKLMKSGTSLYIKFSDDQVDMTIAGGITDANIAPGCVQAVESFEFTIKCPIIH